MPAQSSDDDNRQAEELIKGLELSRLDPQLESILEEMAELESRFGHENDDIIHDSLEFINELLEGTGWLGSPAEYTGKIRLAPWARSDEDGDEITDDAYVEYLKANGVEGEDRHGKYYQVYGLRLTAAMVDTDQSEEDQLGDHHKVALTFYDPATIADAKSQRDQESLLGSAGQYIVYSQDITQLDFRDPSMTQIAVMLERHFPDVHKDIIEHITADDASGRFFLRGLRNLVWPVTAQLASFAPHVGDYIYQRIQPEVEVDYEFIVNGPVSGVSVEHGLVSDNTAARRKVVGKLISIHLIEDDESYRTALLVAEASSNIHGGFEVRQIPVTSIIELRSLRPKRARFGQLAMTTLDEPELVREFWRETFVARSAKVSKDDTSSTIEPEKDPLSAADIATSLDSIRLQLEGDEDFATLIEGLNTYLNPGSDEPEGTGPLADELVLELNQTYRDALQQSEDVMGDIERIRDSYFLRFKEAVDVDPEGEMTLEDITLIISQVMEDVRKLENLNLNDIIKVAPPAVTITLEGDIISLPSEAVIVGRFASVAIGDEPSLMSMITEEEQQSSNLAISIVIENPVIMDEATGEVSGELGSIVSISLGEIVPHIVRAVTR